MPDASVDPASYFCDREFERESAQMVQEWMDGAPQEELTAYLSEVAPERLFDERGEPDELFLDESGHWQAGEVFTALREGRTMADAGNIAVFDTALGRAEDYFEETVLERLGQC